MLHGVCLHNNGQEGELVVAGSDIRSAVLAGAEPMAGLGFHSGEPQHGGAFLQVRLCPLDNPLPDGSWRGTSIIL